MWVIDSQVPSLDEFISDAVSFVNVVNELDNLGIFRLVKIDIRSHSWVLLRQDELEADRSWFVIHLDRQFASDLYRIVL